MPFPSLKLHPSLLRGIAELGFARPTPIQSEAIPAALAGHDVLACATTGSGKTAAFLLPILHQLIDQPRGRTRALVITPTRELAAQIVDELNDLAVHTPVTGAAIFGGVAMGPQEHAFRSGVDVLVATPGRLLDHFEDYIHRVGRTARAEATGDAFTFLAREEEPDLARIERVLGKRLPRVTVPDFDYDARPEARFEVPVAERIAAIRARKADERPRARAKAERSGEGGTGRPPRPLRGSPGIASSTEGSRAWAEETPSGQPVFVSKSSSSRGSVAPIPREPPSSGRGGEQAATWRLPRQPIDR